MNTETPSRAGASIATATVVTTLLAVISLPFIYFLTFLFGPTAIVSAVLGMRRGDQWRSLHLVAVVLAALATLVAVAFFLMTAATGSPTVETLAD
ncbi:hypothetical protein [Salininema proteolyticum]|uniref:DUF4190 domain-containing protein n=1 Tax=Salininema proteolyticum TaxID=1607685 RepID=A0ABV8TS77_9ACTN